MYIYRCPIKLERDRYSTTTFATIGNVDCSGFWEDHDCVFYNLSSTVPAEVLCFDEENA